MPADTKEGYPHPTISPPQILFSASPVPSQTHVRPYINIPIVRPSAPAFYAIKALLPSAEVQWRVSHLLECERVAGCKVVGGKSLTFDAASCIAGRRLVLDLVLCCVYLSTGILFAAPTLLGYKNAWITVAEISSPAITVLGQYFPDYSYANISPSVANLQAYPSLSFRNNNLLPNKKIWLDVYMCVCV